MSSVSLDSGPDGLDVRSLNPGGYQLTIEFQGTGGLIVRDLWPWGGTELVSEDENRTTVRETVMNEPMIVVGVDGSANAQSALEAAVDMAANDGVVHVVTAYRVPSPREMAGVMASLPEEFIPSFDVLDAPRRHLEEAEAFLAERGIDHKGHFIADHPASAILDVADSVGANLIIVGSRGLGRGTRFIRGSVSSRIANHARTSFMVIHDDSNNHNSDSDGMDPIE